MPEMIGAIFICNEVFHRQIHRQMFPLARNQGIWYDCHDGARNPEKGHDSAPGIGHTANASSCDQQRPHKRKGVPSSL